MSFDSDAAIVGLQERQLMDERARLLAKPPPADTDRKLMARVSVVLVGKERFGLPVDSLRALVPCPPITPVPGLPPWMPGVAKTRDSVLCVVDLGRWLGVEGRKGSPTHLAIMEEQPGLLAIGVEGGGWFQDVYADEIADDLSAGRVSDTIPILATTKDLLTILDTPRLFEMSEIRIGAE